MPPPRASGDSGRWHIICWHRDKLCGDLNRQPKRPGTGDLDLESGVLVTCDVGYLCANFSLSIGLSVLDLDPMYVTDVRRRQT